MIKDCYVLNTPNMYWWFPTKIDGDKALKKAQEEYKDYENKNPIRYTYSKCEINELDLNDFSEIEIIEVFIA
jgi:hypothetical protein